MVISRLEEKLRKYPHITYTIGQGRLTVPAPSPTGFSVWVEGSKSRWTVGFEGWHEVFTDDDSALNCFAFGLSTACRLRISSRGGKDYKWEVLSLVEGEWLADSETGLLFFPFWRNRKERVLINDLIQVP